MRQLLDKLEMQLSAKFGKSNLWVWKEHNAKLYTPPHTDESDILLIAIKGSKKIYAGPILTVTTTMET